MINHYPRRVKEFGRALNTSSIISCTDLHGNITYVNENFSTLSGYLACELIGKPHRINNSGIHSREFWSDMWKTISSGHTWRAEVMNKAKNGSYYWVDAFIYPIKDNKGHIIEYLSICNNITDKKKQEFAILKQNDVLGKIAWMQSHGLRRPVSSILGLIQLFQDANNTDRDLAGLMMHLLKMSEELDMKIKEIVRLTEEVNLVANTKI